MAAKITMAAARLASSASLLLFLELGERRLVGGNGFQIFSRQLTIDAILEIAAVKGNTAAQRFGFMRHRFYCRDRDPHAY